MCQQADVRGRESESGEMGQDSALCRVLTEYVHDICPTYVKGEKVTELLHEYTSVATKNL